MGNYKPNELVEKYIQDGEIENLREAIGTIIYNDRAFKTTRFEDAVKYIMNIPELSQFMEDFNSNPPLKSHSIGKDQKITEKDFGDAVFDLKQNFCTERIEDVKKLGKHLYGAAENKVSENTKPIASISKVTGNSVKQKNAPSRHKNKNLKLLITVAGVAAVVTIIALLTRKSK